MKNELNVIIEKKKLIRMLDLKMYKEQHRI